MSDRGNALQKHFHPSQLQDVAGLVTEEGMANSLQSMNLAKTTSPESGFGRGHVPVV